MSTKKKIILLAGVICYVAVIYGYLAQDTTFMMVSVIVYGVLMLLFALTGEAKGETAAAASGNVQEEAGELAMKTDALEKRLRELTEEKNRYAKALEEATAAKEQAIAQRDEAVAQKAAAVAEKAAVAAQKDTASVSGQELLSNLLPKRRRSTLSVSRRRRRRSCVPLRRRHSWTSGYPHRRRAYLSARTAQDCVSCSATS